jgi:hypothetical protein
MSNAGTSGRFAAEPALRLDLRVERTARGHWDSCALAEWARGISPRAPLRSGREPLDSSGSCHRESCRLPLNLRAPPGMTRLLNGDDLPPWLHGHYPASSLLQGSPPLSGASVLSASRLEPLAPFPLASPARLSRSVQEPLTTTAFDRSSLRWLEISTWLPNPKGPPSSLVQLRIAVWTGVTRDTRP